MTTESFVDTLAETVSRKLGRRIKVNREKMHNTWRYYIFVEGCHPAHFGPMNINEAKGRLAMLSDMLFCRVIQKGEPTT